MKTTKLLSILLLLLITMACGDDDDDDNNDTSMDDSEFFQSPEDIVVNTHNEYRSAVGAPDIEWSDELADSAAEWALILSEECILQHSDTEFGENLWMGTEGAFTLGESIRFWGDEIEFYDVESNECVGGECLHYTQMVWSETRAVGCGAALCNGLLILVCQYDPPGNIIGQRPF